MELLWFYWGHQHDFLMKKWKKSIFGLSQENLLLYKWQYKKIDLKRKICFVACMLLHISGLEPVPFSFKSKYNILGHLMASPILN